MAPRQPSKPIPTDERERMEAVLAEMSKAMKGEFFTPEGTPSVPVVMDEGYRTIPLSPGQELIFEDFYLTKTGAPTACFAPVDAQEWTRCEFTLKKLDTFFPLFASDMAGKLGFDAAGAEEAQEVFDRLLSNRKSGWREEEERRKQEEEARLAAEQAAIRDQNPLWGRF